MINDFATLDAQDGVSLMAQVASHECDPLDAPNPLDANNVYSHETLQAIRDAMAEYQIFS